MPGESPNRVRGSFSLPLPTPSAFATMLWRDKPLVRVSDQERDSRRLSGPAISGNKGINPQLFDNKANCRLTPGAKQFHDAPISCSPYQVHRIARLMDIDTLLRVRSFTMSRALPQALGYYDRSLSRHRRG
jgi:hypothetical protein